MLDLAGRRHEHAPPAIKPPHMRHEHVAVHRHHGFLAAEHGPAERLIGIGGGLEMIEDDVVGRVLGLAQLLQHDFAFARQLVGFELRIEQDVADDVERERHVGLHHLGEIGGRFARRIGVEMAAHGFDFLGDVARRAPRRALERHVLEHVGNAVDLGRFVARAGADPDADRGGFDLLHAVGRDGDAVGESRDLNRIHAGLLVCASICANSARLSLGSVM